MTEKYTKGEAHGCIVCGKLYQLYVVNDANGKYVDAKLMSVGGRLVRSATRPLVACDTHTDEQVKHAVERAFGSQADEDE